MAIPDPTKAAENNWGKILSKVKEAIERRSSESKWADPDEKAFFESTYASLDAVRVAWRNTTMHVTIKYTDEEAEHIFVAVRGYMKTLSSRYDENGQPAWMADLLG